MQNNPLCNFSLPLSIMAFFNCQLLSTNIFLMLWLSKLKKCFYIIIHSSWFIKLSFAIRILFLLSLWEKFYWEFMNNSLNLVNGDDENPIKERFKCRRNGCCDQHEWCRFWASVGECIANKDWMEKNCQLACASCSHSGKSFQVWF